MCRSFNTSLTKDNVSRLYFVHCQVTESLSLIVHALLKLSLMVNKNNFYSLLFLL
jgi:hypothetical protein